MKHFTTLLSIGFLLIATLCCFAQTESTSNADNPIRKGRFITDIDFSMEFGTFNSSNAFFTEDISTDRVAFVIDKDFGYSVMDNLVVGVTIAVDNEKNKAIVPESIDGSFAGSIIESTKNGIAFLASGKYYFLEQNIRPYLGVGAGMVMAKTKEYQDGLGIKSKGSGFAYALKVGCAFFINDHIGLEATYQYNGHTLDMDNSIQSVDYKTDDSTSNSSILMGIIVAL